MGFFQVRGFHDNTAELPLPSFIEGFHNRSKHQRTFHGHFIILNISIREYEDTSSIFDLLYRIFPHRIYTSFVISSFQTSFHDKTTAEGTNRETILVFQLMKLFIFKIGALENNLLKGREAVFTGVIPSSM